MKIIVTHASPDWDAITSTWLLKKYLSGWQEAEVRFVPAGNRLSGQPDPRDTKHKGENPIEKIGEDDVIHVDTGMLPLDHHQVQDVNVSAASLVWDYVREQIAHAGHLTPEHDEAVSRVVKIVVDTDHFKEVYWPDAAADRYEFGFLGILEGLKFIKPGRDLEFLEFGILCLNALTAQFENRIWAEREIKEKGIKFDTRFGPGIGFETINDTVLKLSQKMGYVVVVRKDPRKGYIRIKTLPSTEKVKGADLTLAYEQLRKIDPDATWFLHISKKMLLNGSPKNPKMRPTKLSLKEIIKVVERV
ncbi:MAG: hypothetical protein H0W89_05095 [Candidatus Levybacteria bacterium]|nr:hypothetical protein [Candidatus Levybacteria bacterium]